MKLRFIFAAAIPALLLINACQTGELVNVSQQQKLSRERDSLVKIIAIKTTELEARNKNVDQLSADKLALETENKSLHSTVYSKDKQLKNVKHQIAVKDSSIIKENTKYTSRNDSLLTEIAVLQSKVQKIDKAVAHEIKSNEELAQSLKVRDEKRKKDSTTIANFKVPAEIRHGFIDIASIGAGFGLGDSDPDFSRRLFSINNVFGYEINNHFIAGLGTGVNIYNGGFLIPLYVDLRYNIKTSKITPFVIADGGLLIRTDGFTSSNMFINPQFGVSKRINDKIAFHIALGLLVQQEPGEGRNSFINFKGGVSFRGK